MARLKIITPLVFVVITGALIYPLKRFFSLPANAKDESAQTVFIGPKEANKVFGESAENAKGFYDLYRRALNKMDAKDYKTAIKLLNESLPHVGIIVEKSMVYSTLAEIYRNQGKFQDELKYIQAV